ncbi:MAG: DHHW family protein [Oscillospiraceae bacterium]|jgi:hypothetical protein
MSTAKKVSALVFFVLITGVLLLLIFLPKKEFSDNENRVLATFPELSFESITSGEFMKGFETYVADHFFLRDEWISAKTRTELLAGKKEVNGVFVLGDRLIQKCEDYDRTNVAKNVAAMKEFAENTGIPTSVMLVPTACEIQKDLLDPNAPVLNQKMLIDSVYTRLSDSLSVIDAYTMLYSSKDEYIYYKTDHHWTSLGAYFGYSAASKALGYESIPRSSFNIEHASHSFLGTLYSKVIYDDMGPDTIDYYYYPSPKGVEVTTVTVNPGKNEKVYNSLYFREYLEQKDQYSSFLGSNQPVVNVKTDLAGGKKLLVIKDSYAHSLVPFLTQHYSEITMVDLRYINSDLSERVDLASYDQVLFVYNVETFAEDQNLPKLSLTKPLA